MDFDYLACDLYRLFTPKIFNQCTTISGGVADVQVLVPQPSGHCGGYRASKPVTLGLKVLIVNPSVPYKYFLFVFF